MLAKHWLDRMTEKILINIRKSKIRPSFVTTLLSGSDRYNLYNDTCLSGYIATGFYCDEGQGPWVPVILVTNTRLKANTQMVCVTLSFTKCLVLLIVTQENR